MVVFLMANNKYFISKDVFWGSDIEKGTQSFSDTRNLQLTTKAITNN